MLAGRECQHASTEFFHMSCRKPDRPKPDPFRDEELEDLEVIRDEDLDELFEDTAIPIPKMRRVDRDFHGDTWRDDL